MNTAGAHVIFVEGLRNKRYHIAIMVPVVHLLVALASLLNFTQGGCTISVPIILLSGVAVTGFAGLSSWHKAIATLASSNSISSIGRI